jgi:Leucine-rich repeat (LRR) protein
MNNIKEQREQIIAEDNTAQQQLTTFLETMTKGSQELRLTEPLSGDVDLSVLSEYGGDSIHTIIFMRGKITSISNIPSNIITIICPGNLLESVEDLPTSLENLDINNNYLTSIYIANLERLITLNISHNQITELDDIPESVTSLICNHNKLARLDLNGLDGLQHLNVSNNNITVIENLPEGIADFQMENTPSIEFRNSADPTTALESREASDKTAMKNVSEALDAFFKLKSTYDKKIHAAKKQIFQNEPRYKVARKKMLEIKPKCIKCGRAVGTIFSTGKNEGKYTAICGDPRAPCELNISIFMGNTDRIIDLLMLYKDETNYFKTLVIIQKLETLFNYISEDECIRLYKKSLEAYNENNSLYRMFLEKHNDVYNDESNKLEIQKKNETIYRLIERNRFLLNEYKRTDDPNFIKQAVDLQIKELFPEIRNLKILTNDVLELATDNETHPPTFTMHKFIASLDKKEYILGEQPRVIKYRI